MKTLGQIIERSNYTRLTDNLCERTIELAEKLKKGCFLAELEDEGQFK